MNIQTLNLDQSNHVKRNIIISVIAIGVIILGFSVWKQVSYSKIQTETPLVKVEEETGKHNEHLHSFPKYGFEITVPQSGFTNVTCYPDFMRSPNEAKNNGVWGSFCKNPLLSKPFVQIGWKSKTLDNTDFSLQVAGELVTRYVGAGKKFTSTCDNHTGIAITVDAPFSARAFICDIQVGKEKSFSVAYYIFYIGKQADVANWITISDIDKPSSVTREKMIELAGQIRMLEQHKNTSFMQKVFESVYAGYDDSAGGGDVGGGSNGGESTGPDLGTGYGGNVTDSSGNNVGTGCSGCTGGGEGSGNSSPIPPPVLVNGVCAPVHYSCSSGISGSNSENISTWTWSCVGSFGGSTASCTENKPLPTGSLSASPSTCQIAVGASTCQTTLTWSTNNPQGTSGITRDGTSGLLFSGNNDSKTTNVPYDADGTVIYRLYNTSYELANTSVTISCQSGSYDTVGNVCANPQVVSAEVKGKYYPPGTIRLTCSNSNAYSVLKGSVVFVPVTPYTGPVDVSVSEEDNYVMKCLHGSVSDQVARFYDATPEAATVSLLVSPTTVSKNSRVLVSWDTKFPNDSCTLTAKVVCPNGACNQAQLTSSSSLNAQLRTEKTDANDPATSRLITTAVKKVAPGHKENDNPLIVVDWRALGRKTLTIPYTTDLIYDCGGGSKEIKRIQVTNSVEQ